MLGPSGISLKTSYHRPFSVKGNVNEELKLNPRKFI